MRRGAILLIVAAAGGFGWARPAHASGDGGCTPEWTLGARDMSGCDSRLVLGPANDTRINLLLLLRDRHGTPLQPPRRADGALLPHFDWTSLRDAWQPRPPGTPSYLDGEGSRCLSNTEGAMAFAAAVGAARGLAGPERTALIAARNAYVPDCGEAKQVLAPVEIGAAARPWADYLRAAVAFYNGQFAGAAQSFAVLSGARDPWLAETARYMTARVALNVAQEKAFDDWGEPDFTKVDRPALARAQAGFERYLSSYPAGRYAGSARGLLRRVWWLGDDTARLGQAYAALLAQPAGSRGIDDFALAQEIDYKFQPGKPAAINDPLLLAVYDLAAIRANDERSLTAAELAGQRPFFAHEPALYGYLQAAFAFYVSGKPTEVLRLVPDAARERSMSTVALSRQLLRGQALTALGDVNATGFWTQLLPAATAPMQRSVVELGLALNEERTGHLGRILAPGSPLTTPVLRETLLFTVADAPILRRAARSPDLPRHERDVALFQLLYKQLSRGFYADFVRDLALVPAGAPAATYQWEQLIYMPHVPVGVFTQTKTLGDLGCPPLRATAAALAANSRDPRGRLCVADFFQANNFDGGLYDAQPATSDLGGTRSLFPGAPYQRAAVYRELLASPATPPVDKAYALYRSIRCYAPGGYNSCGGAETPKPQRKAWFLRLKRDYPRSRWSQELEYYW